MSDTDDSRKKQEKRKPGRPRKLEKYTPPPIQGISEKPKDSSNAIEFIYSETMKIRSIFNTLKAFNVEEIEFIFTPTEMMLYSTAECNTTKILVDFDVKNIQHYYCSKKIEFGIPFMEIERFFARIDAKYNLINLHVKNNKINHNIEIVFETIFGVKETHTICAIDIDAVKKLESIDIFNDSEYVIDITTPTEFIDKLAGDLNKHKIQSFTFTQNDFDDPIYISCKAANKKTESVYEINNSNPKSLISFDSSRDETDDIFVKDKIRTSTFTPLAKLFTNEMHVLLHEEKPLLVKASDYDKSSSKKTVEIKILIDDEISK